MTKRTTAEIRTALWEAYPACFAAKGQSKAPLKIGIYHDIKATGGFTAAELDAGIRDYTSGPTYLRNMVAGADRIDLDGKPCGKVTKGEAKVAAAKVHRMNQWAKHNKLVSALREAREFVALNLSEVLESSCILDPETLEPKRDTLDGNDRAEVERVEAVLERIDAALSGATGGAA